MICSLHSDRAKVYRLIKKIAEENKFNFFDYVYSNRWSYIRQKYIKRNKSFEIRTSELKFSPLSSVKTAEIYNHSKCLVDYKFPGQDGMTIRTIESIGHKCKLITNNKQIEQEDFYNPQNIWIYDIDNFDIPAEFIQSEYEDVPDMIYSKYTVQGWLEDIFGS